jgi:ketosteroid isomerase-like protein
MIGAILVRIGARYGWSRLRALDAEFFIRQLAEEVVLECPGRTPISGRFVGRHAVAAWYRRYFARLASLDHHLVHTTLDRPYALGLTNTVVTEYEEVATLRDGRTLRGRAIDVTEMRRGKVTASRTYIFDLHAFEEIFGASEDDSGERPDGADGGDR